MLQASINFLGIRLSLNNMHVTELPCDYYSKELESVREQYDRATEWLDSLSLPYSRTRFGCYRKYINTFPELLENSKKISIEEFQTEITQHVNAFSEVSEILRIYNEYEDRLNSDYIDQIKKTMSGQVFRNTSMKDQSRDFSFELTMGARFIRGGFHVELNQLADIVVSRNDTGKIYVECKRIKSRAKVSSNVKKANQQLKKRINREKSKKTKGIVAINITDIVDVEQNLLLGRDASLLKQESSRRLNAFIAERENEINSAKFNQSLGVFAEYTKGGIVARDQRISLLNCRGAALYQYKDNPEAMDKYYRPLSESLANQNL